MELQGPEGSGATHGQLLKGAWEPHIKLGSEGRLEKPVSQRLGLSGLEKALEMFPGQPQGIAVRSRQSGAEWRA